MLVSRAALQDFWQILAPNLWCAPRFSQGWSTEPIGPLTAPHETDRQKHKGGVERGRYVLAFLGLGLSIVAVALTLQARHAVAHRQVESYSTLPVLGLQLAGILTLIAIVRFALGHPRNPRIAAAFLVAFLVCIATTRALWDTSLPNDPLPEPTTQTPPPTTMATRPNTPLDKIPHVMTRARE
jgi:hypothetical protein